MIYLDPLRFHAHGPLGPGEWSHLMADTAEELHAFAAAMGLRREWYQGDHYDLRAEGWTRALELGAVLVSSRDLVYLRRRHRTTGILSPVDVVAQLQAYAAQVDARLEELLPPPHQTPRELHEAMRYSALAPGKRLRPALCMAACEAVGGVKEDALDAACAIEMVHCFSLIHDDLPAIDNDDLRRGRPTCHVQFGEAVAILAGDALFALAFDALAAMPAPADRVVRAISTLTKATGSDGLVGGETTDILMEGKPLDAETLAFIHSKKTGSLIAASCAIGGILGGASDRTVAALTAYGERIGLAFQIADDLLNETATPEQLGKAAGSDRERGKMTYPALYGLEASRIAARQAAEEGIALVAKLGSPFLAAVARFSVERLS